MVRGGGAMTKREFEKRLRETIDPTIRTLDEALALSEESDEMAVRAIVDRIRCRFSGPRGFAALAEGERHVYAIQTMRGEVLNGGFHQYLTNSSGGSAEETRQALAAIGAVAIGQILTRVARVFPGGIVPCDR